MKIRIKKISLTFSPAKWSMGIHDIKCNAELKVHINDDKEITWSFDNIDEETANLLYDCSKNKSLALVNTRSDVSEIKDFCKLKVESFENEKPKTNWKQFNIWCELKKKQNKVNEQTEKAENLLWKSSGKKIEDGMSFDDINKILKGNLKLPQQPVQPQTPYQPIWIDHSGTAPSWDGTIIYSNDGGTTNGDVTIKNASDCASMLLNSTLPESEKTSSGKGFLFSDDVINILKKPFVI